MNRAEPSSPLVSRRRWLILLLALTALAAVALHFNAPSRVQAAMKVALDWLEHLGFWAPVVFVVLYIASCVAVLPAAVLTLGGGAVFGVLKGSILVNIAATLGATAAFLVGRYFARDWVTRRFGHHPAFAAIDRAVAEEGWKIVFLTRLAPIFPFFLMNYAYSVTRVRFSHYVFATWLGIIPGSTLFVFIGWTLRQAGSQQSSLTDWLKYGFIIVTGIIASLYLSRVARRALARRIEPPAGQN